MSQSVKKIFNNIYYEELNAANVYWAPPLQALC